MLKAKLWNWEVSEAVPLIYIAVEGRRQVKYGAVVAIQEDKKNDQHIKVPSYCVILLCMLALKVMVVRPSKLDCLFSVPARTHLRGRP